MAKLDTLKGKYVEIDNIHTYLIYFFHIFRKLIGSNSCYNNTSTALLLVDSEKVNQRSSTVDDIQVYAMNSGITELTQPLEFTACND